MSDFSQTRAVRPPTPRRPRAARRASCTRTPARRGRRPRATSQCLAGAAQPFGLRCEAFERIPQRRPPPGRVEIGGDGAHGTAVELRRTPWIAARGEQELGSAQGGVQVVPFDLDVPSRDEAGQRPLLLGLHPIERAQPVARGTSHAGSVEADWPIHTKRVPIATNSPVEGFVYTGVPDEPIRGVMRRAAFLCVCALTLVLAVLSTGTVASATLPPAEDSRAPREELGRPADQDRRQCRDHGPRRGSLPTGRRPDEGRVVRHARPARPLAGAAASTPPSRSPCESSTQSSSRRSVSARPPGASASRIRDAGLQPTSYLGTETVARLLGLRINHPQSDEWLERGPNMPASRAEAAYSLARVLALPSWKIDWLNRSAETLTTLVLTDWQTSVLSRGVRLVGFPYVFAGTSERPQKLWGASRRARRRTCRLRLLRFRLARLQDTAVRRRTAARLGAAGSHDLRDEQRGACGTPRPPR